MAIKKIISILLCTISLVALCATSVFSEDTPSLSFGTKYIYVGSRSSNSTSLPLTFTDGDNWVTSTSVSCSFTTLFELSTTYCVDLIFSVYSPIEIDISTITVSKSTYNLLGYSTTVLGSWLQYYFIIEFTPNGSPRTSLSINFQVNYHGISGYAKNHLRWDSISNSSERPVPVEPHLDEYTDISYSMYYINEAPSGGSFTSLNHAFLNLPSPIYQSNVSGSPSQFWTGGMLEDWNSVLTDNVVLEGRFTLYVQRTDGSSFPDSMLSTISCLPYFAIGSEPSVGSSWLHVPPPSSWNTSYKLIVDDFLKGKLITFSYYIVTSSDIRSDIQFTPSAFGFILDGGTYIGGDFSYNLLGLYGKYAPRSTPDSPLPDNPNNTLLPGLSSYVPHSSNVYNSQVADELAYLDSILGDNRFKADEVYYNLIDQLLPSTEFDNFYDTLNTLYNSVSYDDIDFEFILPRTSIPWFGNQDSLTLWGDKPIPFKYYIDSLPSQYTAIFGFIVLFSGISVFIGSFLILLRKSFSWSVDTN